MPVNGELSEGMRLREAQLPVQAKRRPSSAICWRRANRRAGNDFSFFTITTVLDDHSANKELKSGSLAPPLPSRAKRWQRLIYEKT
jgi:hypothetical protein